VKLIEKPKRHAPAEPVLKEMASVGVLAASLDVLPLCAAQAEKVPV
jgi:hypothetical protein